MPITNKLVDLDRLKHFKEKTDAAYVAQEEGKALVETTEIQKLKGVEAQAQKNVITEIQVDSVKVEPNETGVVNIDVEAVIQGDNLATDAEVDAKLKDYTKTTEADKKYLQVSQIDEKLDGFVKDDELTAQLQSYATSQSVTALQELINKVGSYKGAIPKASLATVKDTANPGDIYTITDDDNHAYIFCGSENAGENGTDENGFYDLGGHIDLTEIQSEIQNKLNKSEFTEYQSTVEQTYLKTSDFEGQLVFCEDGDIDAMFEAV